MGKQLDLEKTFGEELVEDESEIICVENSRTSQVPSKVEASGS